MHLNRYKYILLRSHYLHSTSCNIMLLYIIKECTYGCFTRPPIGQVSCAKCPVLLQKCVAFWPSTWSSCVNKCKHTSRPRFPCTVLLYYLGFSEILYSHLVWTNANTQTEHGFHAQFCCTTYILVKYYFILYEKIHSKMRIKLHSLNESYTEAL